ncbi:hypothetical protein K439DRAFT_1633778 [Ramaria rubella]|nr:hypothetical protein K439DRAFT_1633778 [Ramaria rubella]
MAGFVHNCSKMSSNAPAPVSKMQLTATILFYLVAALSMVMANKWVLNSTDVPLFFLLSQLVIAVLLFFATNVAGLLPAASLSVDWRAAKGLAPMIGLNVVGLSFSNYTLKYVDASFYQVARGLVLPFTVATSFLFLAARRPSTALISACLVITTGFFVGVFLDSVPVSTIGVSFGVASSLITACHAVVIKRSLEVVGGSALKLSWYMNFLSALVLPPLVILTGEGPGIRNLFAGSASVDVSHRMSPLSTFLWGAMITGTLGFMMSVASMLSIKVTSPITHMVSSAVRGVAASLLGMWLFGDIITDGRAASIATILLGSIYYTWVKHAEAQAVQKHA